MEKILILGANGFIGRHLQEHIRKGNLSKVYYFTGADKVTQGSPFLNCVKVDLFDYKKTERLILKELPDYVINLCGVFNTDDFRMMEDANYGISRNICAIAAKNKLRIRNILLIGSAAEYGACNNLPIKETEPLNPVTPYGLSKAIQTMYAGFYFKNFGVNVTVARTFNLVGRDISMLLSIGSFVRQIRAVKPGGAVYVGNLNTKRDFLDVEDAVRAYWKILTRARSGEVYNVCGGKSYSIKDILDFLIAQSGKKIKVVCKDEIKRKADITDSYGDNTKLKNAVSWQPRKDIFSALADMMKD